MNGNDLNVVELNDILQAQSSTGSYTLFGLAYRYRVSLCHPHMRHLQPGGRGCWGPAQCNFASDRFH